MPDSMKHGIDINAPVVAERLVRWTRERFLRARVERGVIGLSGGVDSTVSATIAARAVGAENVTGVMMPYRTSDRSSQSDAELAAEHLGIATRLIPIGPMADAYLRGYGVVDRVRVGNVCARCRMIVLYDVSAEQDAIVVGTGNRTEYWLGYTTLWGDMAAAFSPVGALWKTQVRQLAEHLGVPRRIVDKVPTADLWEGQTDEGELGLSYDTADEILRRMFDLKMEDAAIVASGFDRDVVERVRALIRSSEFKRRMPESPDPEWLLS